MSVGRSLSLGALVLTVGRVATIGLSFLAIAVMTRSATVAEFGQFRTAMSFLSNAMSIGTLGLNAILVREISRPDASQSAILGAAVVLRVLLTSTALALAALLALVLPLDGPTRLAIAVGSAGFVAYAVHNTLIGLFQQRLDQRGAVLAEVAGSVLFLALVGVLALIGDANAVTFIAMQAVAYLVTIAITWRAAQRLQPFRPHIDWARWKGFLVAGAPLAITGILQVLYYRCDTIFLAVWKGPEAAGLYGVPARVTDGLLGLLYVVLGMVTPLLARHALSDRVKYQEHLDNGLRALAIGTVATAVTLWSFAPEIVRIVGGVDYLGGAPALRVLSLLTIISPLGLLMRDAATALDAQRRLIAGYVAALPVAFLTYALAIPALGATGAALGVLAGEGTGCVWACYVAIRSAGRLPALRGPIAIVVLGVVTAAVLTALAGMDVSWYWRVLVGATLYGGGLLATGSFSARDLRSLLGREAAR